MLGHNVGDTVWYRPEVNTLWWLMVADLLVITMSQLKGSKRGQEGGQGETPWVNQGLKLGGLLLLLYPLSQSGSQPPFSIPPPLRCKSWP